MEAVKIQRKELMEMVKLVSELNDRIESLELMSDPEVMESHRRAKEQIKKREFANWDDL